MKPKKTLVVPKALSSPPVFHAFPDFTVCGTSVDGFSVKKDELIGKYGIYQLDLFNDYSYYSWDTFGEYHVYLDGSSCVGLVKGTNFENFHFCEEYGHYAVTPFPFLSQPAFLGGNDSYGFIFSRSSFTDVYNVGYPAVFKSRVFYISQNVVYYSKPFPRSGTEITQNASFVTAPSLVGTVFWLEATEDALYVFGENGVYAVKADGDGNFYATPFTSDLYAVERESVFRVQSDVFFSANGEFYRIHDGKLSKMKLPVGVGRSFGVAGYSDGFAVFTGNNNRLYLFDPLTDEGFFVTTPYYKVLQGKGVVSTDLTYPVTFIDSVRGSVSLSLDFEKPTSLRGLSFYADEAGSVTVTNGKEKRTLSFTKGKTKMKLFLSGSQFTVTFTGVLKGQKIYGVSYAV